RRQDGPREEVVAHAIVERSAIGPDETVLDVDPGAVGRERVPLEDLDLGVVTGDGRHGLEVGAVGSPVELVLPVVVDGVHVEEQRSAWLEMAAGAREAAGNGVGAADGPES